ncbi:MAG: hypothetical protein GF398_06955 [Chitinivibrionales bacterium]|nr:hypothetical protein [Chitinivibrionales bacterium]
MPVSVLICHSEGYAMDIYDNGKSTLIEGLSRDARHEAGDVRARARQQAEERIQYARRQADTIMHKAEATANTQAQAIMDRARSDANVEIKRMRLAARKQLLDGLIEAVRHSLARQVGADSYRRLLLDWVVEAVRGLDDDKPTIHSSRWEQPILDKSFVDEVQRLCREHGRTVTLAVAKDENNSEQGITLVAADGRQAYNNRVATRMLRREREINNRLQYLIFPESSE